MPWQHLGALTAQRVYSFPGVDTSNEGQSTPEVHVWFENGSVRMASVARPPGQHAVDSCGPWTSSHTIDIRSGARLQPLQPLRAPPSFPWPQVLRLAATGAACSPGRPSALRKEGAPPHGPGQGRADIPERLTGHVSDTELSGVDYYPTANR